MKDKTEILWERYDNLVFGMEWLWNELCNRDLIPDDYERLSTSAIIETAIQEGQLTLEQFEELLNRAEKRKGNQMSKGYDDREMQKRFVALGISIENAKAIVKEFRLIDSMGRLDCSAFYIRVGNKEQFVAKTCGELILKYHDDAEALTIEIVP